MSKGPFVCGVDVGSVSVNVAILDDSGQVLESAYIRHLGHPNRVVATALRDVLQRNRPEVFDAQAQDHLSREFIAEMN